MSDDDRKRRFRLVGVGTSAGNRRAEREERAASAHRTALELITAVRAAALATAPPRMRPGDMFGPVPIGDTLRHIEIAAVHDTGYRLLGEAELTLAGWVARLPQHCAAVVLYDRTYNVVVFDDAIDTADARRANQVATRGRFRCGETAGDEQPPVICTLGTAGRISTVSHPQPLRPAPQFGSSTQAWGHFAAGSDERRTPLYVISDPSGDDADTPA